MIETVEKNFIKICENLTLCPGCSATLPGSRDHLAVQGFSDLRKLLRKEDCTIADYCLSSKRNKIIGTLSTAKKTTERPVTAFDASMKTGRTPNITALVARNAARMPHYPISRNQSLQKWTRC